MQCRLAKRAAVSICVCMCVHPRKRTTDKADTCKSLGFENESSWNVMTCPIEMSAKATATRSEFDEVQGLQDSCTTVLSRTRDLPMTMSLLGKVQQVPPAFTELGEKIERAVSFCLRQC